nr:hypothetical protein [Lachnospiraceae bacterium]
MKTKIFSLISIILTTILIVTVPNTKVVSHEERTSALGSPLTSETTISYNLNNPGTLLNFGHERTYGACFRFDWTIPFEGYYGFHVTTSGTKATLKHYDHM